jgi:dihydrofolate reductase
MTIFTGASMSLDAYISGPDETGFEIDAASDLAGGKDVGVNGGTIARQCVDAGRLDEIRVELVPVLLGGGTPFFESLGPAPVELGGPLSIVEGVDVTQLRYRVRRR